MGKNPKIMNVDNKNRLKILFLPAWYPSEKNPISGVFIREHAKAASLYNEIVVLYVDFNSPSIESGHEIKIADGMEDGIRTIRVGYGGILSRLKRLIEKTGPKQNTPSSAKEAQTPFWFKPLQFFGSTILRCEYYWVTITTVRKLLKEGWKPDIIHAHVYTAGVIAVILGKIYKIPVVITEHYTGVANHSLTYIEQIKLRFAMNNANAIFPVSDGLGLAIKNYYNVKKTKIVTIPNTVNTEFFFSPDKRNNQREKKKILTVCILTPQKGINYLLEAVNIVRQERQDFTLDIVGDGPNREEYETLSRNLNLTSVVEFHGRQPEVASFMKECDFFVQPSLWETFGVVYIEAMACGKPVIASQVTGPLEIINDDVGILVPPRDVKALIKAIEYMLDNYQAYSSDKIAKYAQERFSYEAVGKRLDEVYNNLIRTEEN